MKHGTKFFAAIGLVVGLSQFSFGQYNTTGTLDLLSENSGLSGSAGIYYAGLVNMTFTPNEGPNNGVTTAPFVAYCTVLDVEIGFGSTWGATQLLSGDFTPQPPADQSNDNANYNLLYGSNLTTDDAIVGGELAYVADNDSGTALQDAAAQIAIWDLEQGGNGTAADGFFGAGTNLPGGFYGNGVESTWAFNGQTGAVNALAMADAAGAYNNGNYNSASETWFKADLDSNNIPVSQDFLTPSGTPEPFTLAIGAAGIGIALRRRFSRKA